MTYQAFFIFLVVGSLVMFVGGRIFKARDDRRYRESPPDLGGFSSTIDSGPESR